jgi:hypothetical protein
MTDHNQKLEPADFKAAVGSAAAEPGPISATPATDRSTASSNSPSGNKWLLPALGGLLLAALLVFFWLPQRVSTPAVELELEQPVAENTGTSKRGSSGREEAEVSPWSDAQLARQRKEAQEVLAQLLEEQFKLEEQQVQRWAAQPFLDAQAFATLGDEQYRGKEFEAATATYQQGLDAMLAIGASAGQVFDSQLALGESALLADDWKSAITALELALLLQPQSAPAQQAMQRAMNLEQVLGLWQNALAERDNGALEAAQQLLQEAHNLDPAHEAIEVDLNTIGRDIIRQNFNRAMTQGYQAMDQGDFAGAEKHFQQARRIMPAAPEIDSALQQARTGHTSQQIDTWQQRAQTAVANEQWPQAAKAYKEILAIDASVVFAREGESRASQRAGMDQRISKVLADPGRLADEKVFRQTRALYDQGLAVADKGPTLKRQLQELEQVLRQALLPIAVLLQSDEQTDVTVFKVAHLGTFRRQQLELKPGTYTAVGVRSGYRDVRREFTVSHNQQNPNIEIACTEPI